MKKIIFCFLLFTTSTHGTETKKESIKEALEDIMDKNIDKKRAAKLGRNPKYNKYLSVQMRSEARKSVSALVSWCLKHYPPDTLADVFELEGLTSTLSTCFNEVKSKRDACHIKKYGDPKEQIGKLANAGKLKHYKEQISSVQEDDPCKIVVVFEFFQERGIILSKYFGLEESRRPERKPANSTNQSCQKDVDGIQAEIAKLIENGTGHGHGGPKLICPHDSNYTYQSLNTTATRHLLKQGWKMVKQP